MIWRIGSLFAEGPTISAYPGYGILADYAPSDGENGPALGYRPEWFGKQVRCEVVVQPTNGTLEIFEDTSIIYTGNGQPDSAQLQFYLDGIAEPAPETLQFNPITLAQNYSTTAVGNTLTAGQAVTSAVNTATNVQNYSTTAAGNTLTAGAAVTSAVNVATLIQHLSTTAAGKTVQGGTALTSAVNAAVIIQNYSTTAIGNVVCRGFAITSFYDDGYVPPFSRVGLSASIRRPGYSATLIQ